MSDIRDYILECMRKERGKLLCTDEAFSYYTLFIDGRAMLYRRVTLKPNSRRGFMFTNQLAALLGFQNLHIMKFKLDGLQYWRGFVSPERLQKALDKFRNKWGIEAPFIY